MGIRCSTGGQLITKLETQLLDKLHSVCRLHARGYSVFSFLIDFTIVPCLKTPVFTISDAPLFFLRCVLLWQKNLVIDVHFYCVQDPSIVADQLVPIPTVMFRSSLLLGSIVKLFVGDDVNNKAQVLLHPLTIAGWCGLVTTALNTLPMGRLDGGRAMLAAYGRGAVSACSIFAYAGLGLGVIGSSLALPFGLYVLICQRGFEDQYRDQVTPIDDQRKNITIGAISLALLILIPIFPLSDAGANGMML